MLSPRDADTLEAVVSEMIEILGAKRAAHLLGKGTTVIYDAASESSSYMLPWRALLMLDSECLSVAQIAPMYRWWGRQIRKGSNGKTRVVADLTVELLDVVEKVGELGRHVREAECPNGDGGTAKTPAEIKALKGAIKSLEDEIDDIKLALDKPENDAAPKLAEVG